MVEQSKLKFFHLDRGSEKQTLLTGTEKAGTNVLTRTIKYLLQWTAWNFHAKRLLHMKKGGDRSLSVALPHLRMDGRLTGGRYCKLHICGETYTAHMAIWSKPYVKPVVAAFFPKCPLIL